MTNRILSVTLCNHSLVPAESIVHVTVVPERIDSGTEIRGRLMGPRCAFASTIEVAYHLRPLPRQDDPTRITLRAVIPESSFWEPQSPHLYAGPVELWQDGQRCQVMQRRHGLRQVALGPRGLRLNGNLLQLRGRQVTTLDDDSALALRESGYNLVVAPASDESRQVWEIADRIGLFVLGLRKGESALTRELRAHPSYLGWLTGLGQASHSGDDGHIEGDPGGDFKSIRAYLNTPTGNRNGTLLYTGDLREDANAEGSFGTVD